MSADAMNLNTRQVNLCRVLSIRYQDLALGYRELVSEIVGEIFKSNPDKNVIKPEVICTVYSDIGSPCQYGLEILKHASGVTYRFHRNDYHDRENLDDVQLSSLNMLLESLISGKFILTNII